MSKIFCGNATECLKTLPNESINMCVTSPPYYGLRDYGEDGQIGVEQTPQEYIDRLVSVFDEVWRVLKKDGTLWLNIGDCYAGSGKGPMTLAKKNNTKNKTLYQKGSRTCDVPKKWSNIKPKDMIGIPWMLAFALREKGWYLRSDIIWYKKNCMPESIKDRPTKTYEHIFLLSKSRRYYYDYKSIQEPIKKVTEERYLRGRSGKTKHSQSDICQGIDRMTSVVTEKQRRYRRKRDVWEVSTNTYRMDEHFAMFPEKLIEPCILAGSPVGGVVLDPFFGSGTTGAVAKRYGREYIGIDINNRYCEKAQQRIDRVNAYIADNGNNGEVECSIAFNNKIGNGEIMRHEEREIIRTKFNAQVKDEYGHFENSVLSRDKNFIYINAIQVAFYCEVYKYLLSDDLSDDDRIAFMGVPIIEKLWRIYEVSELPKSNYNFLRQLIYIYRKNMEREANDRNQSIV